VVRRPLRDVLFSFGDNWYCVGPTLIMATYAPGPASWSHWPIYAAAFASQFISDTAISAGRRVLEFRSAIPDRETVLFPIVVDALLTPVGLAAAINARQAPAAAVAVVLGVVGVLWLLARERADRLKQEQRALHDPLTGLANRELFDALLDSTARRCARARTSGGVLLLDLTRFKHINDSYGHAYGDRVLCEFALRVRACVRDSDTVARIGGDEFAVLLDEPATLADAQAVASKLRCTFSSPIEIPGAGEMVVDASIGAASFDADVTPPQALAEADDAMYAEKRAKPALAGRIS
jgi:diguanylate cyclase (GGDEF)-like protein